MNKNPIPLFKVFMSEEAADNSKKVLQSGYITQGPVVDEFEKKLSGYFNVDRLITVNSATSGLHLIVHMLKNYGLTDDRVRIENDDDHILTTPLTCTASNWPILLNNVNLRWVDVDSKTCNMSLDDLQKKLTKNTKAVLIVHWGGYPIDLDKLRDIQNDFEKKHGFKFVIIEDSAHAFGAKYKENLIGSHGNINSFSFQAIKHLTSVDGGSVIFNNTEDFERSKLLRWYGIDRNENRKDFRCEDDIEEIGFKFHMNDVNASIGLSNFDEVTNNLLHIYIENAKYYQSELKDVNDLTLLDYSEDNSVPFWIYTIKVKNRDEFMLKMKEKNIITSRVHERNDIHSAVKKFKEKLPELDSFIDEMICIPVGWWVTPDDREYIVKTIKEGW